MDFELRGDECRELEIRVERLVSAGLLIDITTRIDFAKLLAQELWTNADYRRRFTSEVVYETYDPVTRLMVSLIGDPGIHAALFGFLRTDLTHELAAWLDTRIRTFWRFYTSPEVADGIISTLVRNRLRLASVLRATFLNQGVATLVPDLREWELNGHLCWVLSLIDSPELDSISPFLGQLYQPNRALVEKVARSLFNSYEVRPAIGLAQGGCQVATERGIPATVLDGQQEMNTLHGESAHWSDEVLLFRAAELASAVVAVLGDPAS